MKIIQTIFFLLLLNHSSAQIDSTHFIKVHFLYGSVPKKEYKSSEYKSYGGIHGGHVSIEVDGIDYNFEPTYKHHLFPHPRRKKADIVALDLNGQPRYSGTSKTATFIIPLTNEQYIKIKQIHTNYCKDTPYDYAFFGMRCASSTQDILGQIGILKKKSRFINILTTFYPKKLRKRLFKIAQQNNYQITQTTGRDHRKWEND